MRINLASSDEVNTKLCKQSSKEDGSQTKLIAKQNCSLLHYLQVPIQIAASWIPQRPGVHKLCIIPMFACTK